MRQTWEVINRLARAAATRAEPMSETTTITVSIRGGVAADVQGIPPGAVVEVLDYDIEGFEDDLLESDDVGIPCHRSIWRDDAEQDGAQ